MDAILKKLTNKARDTQTLARAITESGLKSVSSVLRGTPIFGALTAASDETAEYDETHYVLIPLLGAEKNYAIYTKRILPLDVGANNSLPKARIFHVPDEAGTSLLERELVAELINKRCGEEVDSSELADTLEKLADQIDGETNKISGGFLLIGSAVAIVNPLLGIGIATQGLIPAIGAKASKVGAEYVGNKLRQRNKTVAKSKIEKKTTNEIRKLKPQIYPNPITRSLEAIAANPQTNLDPAFDHRNWIDQFKSPRHYAVTLEAIQETYQEAWHTLELSPYQESHLRWVRSFFDESSQ